MGVFVFPSLTSRTTSDEFAIEYLRREIIHPRSLKPTNPGC